MSEHETTTVPELAALVTRTAQALADIGRTELAERCCVIVDRTGKVHMRFLKPEPPQPPHHDPDVIKALSFDPVFDAPAGPCVDDKEQPA